MVGRLKQDRWDTDQGEKRSKVVIVAEHVEFKPAPKEKESDAAVESNDEVEV